MVSTSILKVSCYSTQRKLEMHISKVKNFYNSISSISTLYNGKVQEYMYVCKKWALFFLSQLHGRGHLLTSWL